MTQSTNTPAAVSGRATGVLFFAGFGSLWLCTGLSAMHSLNPITLAAVLAILATLVLPAARLIFAAAKAPQAETLSADEAQTKRAFNRINAIQWIAIVASVVVLNLLQKHEFLVPVIAFIVGMHLFPLAKLFRYPAHNVTGTLLVLWSMGVVAALPPPALASAGALGAGVILLGSAAYTLTNASRAAKSSLASRGWSSQATEIASLGR